MRALHAAPRERDPFPVPPASLPATASSSPSSPSQKLVLFNNSPAPQTWEGRSFCELSCTCEQPPLFPSFCIIFVSKQLKIPPLSSEPKLRPKHQHHSGSQTSKQEARKTPHNYSEPPWKEGCSKSTASLLLRISYCGRTLPNSCCILLERVRSPWK